MPSWPVRISSFRLIRSTFFYLPARVRLVNSFATSGPQPIATTRSRHSVVFTFYYDESLELLPFAIRLLPATLPALQHDSPSDPASSHSLLYATRLACLHSFLCYFFTRIRSHRLMFFLFVFLFFDFRPKCRRQISVGDRPDASWRWISGRWRMESARVGRIACRLVRIRDARQNLPHRRRRRTGRSHSTVSVLFDQCNHFFRLSHHHFAEYHFVWRSLNRAITCWVPLWVHTCRPTER